MKQPCCNTMMSQGVKVLSVKELTVYDDKLRVLFIAKTSHMREVS